MSSALFRVCAGVDQVARSNALSDPAAATVYVFRTGSLSTYTGVLHSSLVPNLG